MKEFAVITVTGKTQKYKTVYSILKVLEEKYVITMEEKMIRIIKDISEFKIEGDAEKELDEFKKMMVETKKLDLSQNLDFTVTLQFIESLEKSQ